MSEADRTRVLVVDDHIVLRKGIVFSLLSYDDIEVVAEAATGEEAILVCQGLAPDVVLMDLHLPGMGGCAATRTIRDICPDTQVIALTGFEEGHLVQDVLQAGAIGYLIKDIQADHLAEAIRKAHLGRPSLAQAAAQALVQGMRSRPPQLGQDLTEREREVLALLVEGCSNGAIAERLVITSATVKFHVRTIRTKLGSVSRTQTAVLALQHQLVDVPAGAASARAEARLAPSHM